MLTHADKIKARMSYENGNHIKIHNLLSDIQDKINEQSDKGYYSIKLGSDPKYDIEYNLFTGQYGSAKENFKNEIASQLVRNGYGVDLKYDQNNNKYWVITW